MSAVCRFCKKSLLTEGNCCQACATEHLKMLATENARLREALENIVPNGDLTMYASKELIWKWLKDSQRIARKALERAQENNK